MAHISPIESHSIVQYTSVHALLFLSLLCYPPPYPPNPGSLVADWVVIVIKSSCTARENTKLSANGWSSVGGWTMEGSWSLSTTHPTHTMFTQCCVFLFFVLPPPFFYVGHNFNSKFWDLKKTGTSCPHLAACFPLIDTVLDFPQCFYIACDHHFCVIGQLAGLPPPPWARVCLLPVM